MIIAIDFDGILCQDDGTFPKVGPPIYSMVSFTRELIDMGHEVVLWTSRTGKALQEAVAWCNDRGLHFCAVNENAPSNEAKYRSLYPEGTRKIYADLYIDDHNVEFVRSVQLESIDAAIQRLIGLIRRLMEDGKKQQG